MARRLARPGRHVSNPPIDFPGSPCYLSSLENSQTTEGSLAKTKYKYELQGRSGNVVATTWAYSEAQAYRNFAFRNYPVDSELLHIAGGPRTESAAPVAVQQSDLFGRRS